MKQLNEMKAAKRRYYKTVNFIYLNQQVKKEYVTLFFW